MSHDLSHKTKPVEKAFDVTEVKSNAFAFVQDLTNEIYRIMAKSDGHYIFTLEMDRVNNKTELTIEEVST